MMAATATVRPVGVFGIARVLEVGPVPTAHDEVTSSITINDGQGAHIR